MQRHGVLYLITAVSILLVLALPLYLRFVSYPAYKSFLTHHAERALETLATQIVENHYVLHNHLTDEPLSEYLISDHLRKEIIYFQNVTGIPKVKIFSTDGIIVYSTDSADLGKSTNKNFFPAMLEDRQPRSELKIIPPDDTHDDERYMLESYVPIYANEIALGAFELYYDITELSGSLEAMSADRMKFLFPLVVLLLLGGIVSSLLAHKSMTELSRAKDQFQQISVSDPLTGLLNRRGFNAAVEAQLKYSQRANNNNFMIFIDMDEFKQINDEHGHELGDQALIGAAEILKATFRDTDIIGRMGGDEFAVLACPIKTQDDEARIRARLQYATDYWNEVTDTPYTIGFSVGISFFSAEESCGFEELIAQADADMYQQKNKRKAMRG